jgi:hypothetical protein
MPGGISLATSQERMMRVSWVFASGYQIDPGLDIEKFKLVGPTWGSWKTWRSCSTDNVVCHDLSKAQDLIKRAFQAVCNFYVPRAHYQDLSRPIGIKLYDGEFAREIIDLEDVISMHLAADSSDIVLLAGFDFSQRERLPDRLENHRINNYHNLIRGVISQRDLVQWVAVDHPKKFDDLYQNLTNLTCDTMENALQLLI